MKRITTHPGELFRRQLIPRPYANAEEAAIAIGISIEEMNNFLNSNTQCPVRLAELLSKATGISIDLWLNMQKLHNESKAP